MLSLTWCSLSVLLLALTSAPSSTSSSPLSSRAHLLQQQRHQLLLQRAAEARRSNNKAGADDDDAVEYDDFGIMPPFLEHAYVAKEITGPKGKRYLGIDIPDYISAGGRSDAIKSMSDKMKALGRK